MKKLLSVILSALLLISSAVVVTAWEPQSTEYTPLPRGNDVIARIVLGSDTHIGYGGADDKLNNAYASIKKLGGLTPLSLRVT